MIPILNEAVLAVSGWTELSIVVKATLILAGGLVCTTLARRSTSSVRHLVLAAMFVAILVLPVVVLSAPEVAVPIDVQIAASPTRATVTSVDSSVTGVSQSPAIDDIVPRAAQPGKRIAAASVLRIVWVPGVVLLLVSLTYEMWRLRCLRRRGLPALEFHGLFQEVTGATQMRRRVELLLHEDVPAPLTCGILRPVILLPIDAVEWSEDDLRRALIHELEHVRRCDWVIQLIARAACACYWFHPLAWVAWRRLALEAERACDDAVVRHEDGTDYADQLLSLARKMSHTAEQPALGMAKRGDLSARVTALLDGAQRRERAGAFAAAVVIGAASLIVLSLGPVRAVAQQPSVAARDSSQSPELDRSLFEAAEEGDVTTMQRLLTSGANVNATLSGDGSPLIAAARNGQYGAVALLIDRGADPNLAAHGDGSPLIMAARNGHLATVRLLLQRGADIHKPVPGDGNPLIMAARGGHLGVVEYLLEHGANIEQVVPGDENALIEASASGHLAVVKMLVARGANVNARVWAEASGVSGSGEWRTPLNMARRRGHSEVVSFLQSVGGRE
jgi:beta-lactamase regulating signal transducer with metallopeptidase domain